LLFISSSPQPNPTQPTTKIFSIFDGNLKNLNYYWIRAPNDQNIITSNFSLYRSLGEELTDQELNKMAPSGRIDFNAFLANRQDKWAKAQSGEDVVNAFAFFDVNGDGRVPVELLRGVLTQLGEPLSDAEFNKMVQDAEGTGGTIDYRRFVEKMKKNAY